MARERRLHLSKPTARQLVQSSPQCQFRKSAIAWIAIALGFTLRREFLDFVIDNFEGASRLKRRWPAVVCWTKPLEPGCDQATQQSTGLLCLRPIMGQEAVEYDMSADICVSSLLRVS
jgi:hypothetical protein